MLGEEFEKMMNDRANTFNRDFKKGLHKFKFDLERRGKKTATQDFYQPTTRAGFERDYKLTGRLRSSIVSGFIDTRDGFGIALQAGGMSRGGVVDYADDLEFGTSGIKPFFFLGRSVKEEQENLPDFLRKLLKLQLSPSGI
tara:strand:+ start:3086 stop:3508 length:423 start_codon:yes stop_codon:yes gene_type:complete